VIRVGEVCATRVEDLETRTLRDGIRIPLMPLAEWLVSNWWYLCHEGPHSYPPRSLRRMTAHARSWYRRHNLLFAREGFPLPDLIIASADEERCLIQTTPDPRRQTKYPVRFVEDHAVFVPRLELQTQLRRFLDAVLARLEGCEETDACELRDAWGDINELTSDDLTLRERAGALGLDGDDPEAVTDELAAYLVDTLGREPASLVHDLLELPADDAIRPSSLSWLDAARENVLACSGDRVPLPRLAQRWAADARASGATIAAHQVGWQLASVMREELFGLDEAAHGEDLDAALEHVIQVLPGAEAQHPRGLRGYLGTLPSLAVQLEASPEPTRRFLGARALCLGVLGGPERMITDAPRWNQSLCRAFATELIAPCAYLRSRVHDDVITEHGVEQLALELNAPRRAVEHQVLNHDIARLD
jgi:hypothetical protein